MTPNSEGSTSKYLTSTAGPYWKKERSGQRNSDEHGTLMREDVLIYTRRGGFFHIHSRSRNRRTSISPPLTYNIFPPRSQQGFLVGKRLLQ